MAVDVGGSNFGFGGQTHHVGHDAGNGVDRAVEARTGGIDGNYQVITLFSPW